MKKLLHKLFKIHDWKVRKGGNFQGMFDGLFATGYVEHRICTICGKKQIRKREHGKPPSTFAIWEHVKK